MIGFILSKLNLLILVTTIFAIVAYFSFWLGDSMVSKQAQQIISRYSRNAETIIFSPNQCNVTNITIPSYMNFFGSFETGNRFFYLLDISKIENVPTPDGSRTINYLIVSVKDKKSQNTIAAKSFGTNAEIKLFYWNPKDDTLTEMDKNTTMNPQSFPPTNSVYLVKDVFEGKQYFFVIPCSAGGGQSCKINLECIGVLLKQKRGFSGCIPSDSCQKVISAGSW